jgi:hypothetical protein
MLVREDMAWTGWRTWCGYGLAHEDTPGPYLGVTNSKLCSNGKCLEADASADDTMGESKDAPFAYQQLVS